MSHHDWGHSFNQEHCSSCTLGQAIMSYYDVQRTAPKTQEDALFTPFVFVPDAAGCITGAMTIRLVAE